MQRIDQMMKHAIKAEVFPGGVLLVARDGSIEFFEAYGYADLFEARKIKKDSFFDLASLTKPLATTMAVLWLVQQRVLDLKQQLGKLLPGFAESDKAEISVRHLLCHNSGISDYRPYYEWLQKKRPCHRYQAVTETLMAEPMIYAVGSRTVYSDLGFMLLRRVVEQVSGQTLDELLKKEIYEPLGIHNLFFPAIIEPVKANQYAATEFCLWRKDLVCGQVHDENAYAMGGIEGHAGLFGSAMDVYRLLHRLVRGYHGDDFQALFQPAMIKLFFQKQKDSERALGFDMPSATGSSSGRYFHPHSVGHLGFTGTSFWLDTSSRILVILLTNRIHPRRENIAIRTFRPFLHDALIETLTKRSKLVA